MKSSVACQITFSLLKFLIDQEVRDLYLPLKFVDPRLMDFFKKQGKKQFIHDTSSMDKWLCPNTSLTCWEKAHSFYIPNGLFHSNLFYRESFNNKADFNETAKFNLKSKLYLLRKETLKNATSNITPTSYQKRNGQNVFDGDVKKEEGVVHLVTADIMNGPIQVPNIEENIEN